MELLLKKETHLCNECIPIAPVGHVSELQAAGRQAGRQAEMSLEEGKNTQTKY